MTLTVPVDFSSFSDEQLAQLAGSESPVAAGAAREVAVRAGLPVPIATNVDLVAITVAHQRVVVALDAVKGQLDAITQAVTTIGAEIGQVAP